MPAILNWLRAAVLVVAAFTGGGPVARADANFLGKTITIFIGYGVGGSYHFYAQLFAHHLGRFLPGQPAVIVQSSPGAGGVRMLNEAAVKMRADGTNLFIPPDTMVVTQLLQPTGLAYDARKFRYIGTADQQNTFWVVRRGPHSSLEGMRAGETFMGSSGKGSTGYMIPALAAPLLGLKIKHVGGYNSSREMILAMDKSEIDGTLQAWQVWKQSRPAWFEPNGFAVPVIQVGAMSDPDAPNTPLLRDLVAPNDKPLASLFDTIGVLGRSLAAPAGVSDEDLAALRDGFNKMSTDPEFIEEARRSQLRLLPRSGADLEAAVADAFSGSSPDVVRRAQVLTQ
jgi:tripartite-type tricarboxylate transporter receptor subunit TctC